MAGINHEAVKSHGDPGSHTEWNADHRQKGHHDCEQYQFLNRVMENRTDWPAGPVEGQEVWRSDLNNAFIWDGTKWVSLSPVATIVVAADGSGHTTDIQEGIDMLPAGGGAVYIKEGTYLINVAVDIDKSNVSIFGSGRSTILKGAAGITILEATNKNHLSIRDLYLTSQTAVQYGVGIGLADSTGSFVESCWFDNFTGIGVALLGTTTGTTIRNCNIFPGSAGIGLKGNDGVIEGCYIEGGFNGIAADNGAERYRIIGNIITGVTFRGIMGSGFNDCAFVGNYIGDCGNDSVNIQSSNRNTFTGNKIVNATANGIEIDINSDRNLVVGNTIYNNAAGNIVDNGTNSEIAHNIIA